MSRFPNVLSVRKVPEVPKVKKVFSGTGSSQELVSRSSSTLKKVHLVVIFVQKIVYVFLFVMQVNKIRTPCSVNPHSHE